MKLFIAGISGLLGLNLAFQARGRFQISGCYHTHPVAVEGVQASALDITSYDALKETLNKIRPDVIVHAAGLTNVDECEVNPKSAYRLNVLTAKRAAELANELGVRFVFISTDHIFDGTNPWKTEREIPRPINVYAKTKQQAEQVVLEACPDALIIRTVFFGWGTSVRTSFSDWIFQAMEQSRTLNMFTDVYFTPILVNDLIDFLLELVALKAKGIFHVAGGERLSKHSFAIKMSDVFGYSNNFIKAISVRDFPFKAKRPEDMSLSCKKAEKFLRVQMPPVKDGLCRLRKLHHDKWQKLLEEAVLPRGPKRNA